MTNIDFRKHSVVLGIAAHDVNGDWKNIKLRYAIVNLHILLTNIGVLNDKMLGK